MYVWVIFWFFGSCEGSGEVDEVVLKCEGFEDDDVWKE